MGVGLTDLSCEHTDSQPRNVTLTPVTGSSSINRSLCCQLQSGDSLHSPVDVLGALYVLDSIMEPKPVMVQHCSR
jgi:hypothetical protein